MLRLVSLLTAAALAAGCGQAAPSPALTAARAFAAFAAEPAVNQQIDEATVERTAAGTHVARLPRTGGKAVTFLAYKALDNTLGVTLEQHLNILERAGSSRLVNAVAFTDDIGPKNTRHYYLRQDDDAGTITSPYEAADGRGDMNTGAVRTLKHAVKWGFETYPGRLRWLDINSHGGGYYGISQDDRSESIIRLPALASALAAASGGQPLDLLSFDACLMATIEVAYELRQAARVMVASEDSSYALGMNYDQTLEALAEAPTRDPRALGRDLVLRSERKGRNKALYTVSAIDLSRAEIATRAVDQLARALLAALPTHRQAIRQALAAVPAFYVAGPDRSDFNHRDLNQVAEQLRLRVPDTAIQNACFAVKTTLFGRGGAILVSRSAREERGAARGLSIYLPTEGQVDPIYRETSFAKQTLWDDALAAILKSTP